MYSRLRGGPKRSPVHSPSTNQQGYFDPLPSPGAEFTGGPPSPNGQKPLYLCQPFVKAALVKGSFKTIVAPPKYVDVNEWVAVNCKSSSGLALSFFIPPIQLEPPGHVDRGGPSLMPPCRVIVGIMVESSLHLL
jgi:hypothetical protein